MTDSQSIPPDRPTPEAARFPSPHPEHAQELASRVTCHEVHTGTLCDRCREDGVGCLRAWALNGEWPIGAVVRTPPQASSLRPQAGLEASSAGSPSDFATIASLEMEITTLRSTHATLQSALHGLAVKWLKEAQTRRDYDYKANDAEHREQFSGGRVSALEQCAEQVKSALNGAPGTE